MLHKFVTKNRAAIITRCRALISDLPAPRPTEEELEHGVPLFLDQLVERLLEVGSKAEIGKSATMHAQELRSRGFTIAQVVRDYGDICQAITSLAVEHGAPITPAEFQILNLALDNAIAGSVSEYARLHDYEGTERLGHLAHELRNQLNTALLAFGMIESGKVTITGSTGGVLLRSLRGLRDLIDRELADVRLGGGLIHREKVSVRDFLEDVEVTAVIEAKSRRLSLSMPPVAGDVIVFADKQILASVVSNLLQNAFKFTKAGGQIVLQAHATEALVLIEVRDECGGIPPDQIDRLFQPFQQGSADRSGVGLGLAICKRGAEANGGVLRVDNKPGSGCVFTLELPRVNA